MFLVLFVKIKTPRTSFLDAHPGYISRKLHSMPPPQGKENLRANHIPHVFKYGMDSNV
jgi:hypothetical protein